jgi:beta-glucanase (GH16 family)
MAPANVANFSIKDTHNYMFEWTPAKVTWFVDGVMLRSNMGNTKIPTNSAKIMMNLWVFGSDAAFGIVGNNVYPFSATYEWIRFYKSNTETTYPYENPKTQLPAGDVDFSKNNPNETVYP